MRTLLSFQDPAIFFFFCYEGFELANTGYGTSIHLKNVNLACFAILLDNNITFADYYVIFKSYENI